MASICPPPSNSNHQDYYIFRRESPNPYQTSHYRYLPLFLGIPDRLSLTSPSISLLIFNSELCTFQWESFACSSSLAPKLENTGNGSNMLIVKAGSRFGFTENPWTHGLPVPRALFFGHCYSSYMWPHLVRCDWINKRTRQSKDWDSRRRAVEWNQSLALCY